MNQAEKELFFEKDMYKSTLSKVERSKLIPSPQGNHERSLIGQKWFYFGETKDEYSLFYDEIVWQTKDVVFVEIVKDNQTITDSAVAIKITDLEKRYPVQDLFPKPMEEKEALSILKNYFKNQ